MQAIGIKPRTGTCSLGQDGSPATSGNRRSKESPRLAPAPFREIPQDTQKE